MNKKSLFIGLSGIVLIVIAIVTAIRQRKHPGFVDDLEPEKTDETKGQTNGTDEK